VVRSAGWITIHAAAPTDEMLRLRAQYPLGSGELATILLARRLNADLVIMDERSARRLAQANTLPVIGCVGVLDTGHRKGLVTDLRAAYEQLLLQGIRIDRQILDQSLIANGFKPL